MNAIVEFTQKTMSSREIATLCEKEHKEVVRDIRVMLLSLYGDELVNSTMPQDYKKGKNEYIRSNLTSLFEALIDGANLLHQKNQGVMWEKDVRGYITEFKLDKEHSYTLVSGYKIKLRNCIIKRWQELEAKQNDPIALLSDPNILRSTLLTYSEKVIELEHKVEVMQPDVDAYERIAKSDGGMCLTDAAKNLQMRPRKFNQWLHSKGWIYRRNGSNKWTAYQPKLQSGHLEHKAYTVEKPDGTEKTYHQVLVTPKGLAALAKLKVKEAA